ncbi:hypothetical protein [Micromonospora sp. NPDC005324]|uniref:hypothetical protein n=1 Tax=Micromonospora sp. NPDC005324 TaxID=3157033 RepID=UPI0033BAF215
MSINPAEPGETNQPLSSLLSEPVQRDLPDGRRSVLREYLMHEITTMKAAEGDTADTGPARVTARHRTRRWALAGAFAAVVAGAAIAGPALLSNDGDSPGDVLAFGTAAVSPRLQQAIDTCRERVSQVAGTGVELKLANSGEAGDYAVAVFLTDTRMLVCDAGPNGGGGQYGPYKQATWLPGPISVESFSTNDGDVLTAGRISDRVDRVELDHGDGTRTRARLNDGTFAVATHNAGIKEGAATLITYDKQGKVIDRRSPEFLANTLTTKDKKYAETCWTDPTGKAVYGTPGNDCKPAEPWN